MRRSSIFGAPNTRSGVRPICAVNGAQQAVASGRGLCGRLDVQVHADQVPQVHADPCASDCMCADGSCMLTGV